MAFRWSTFFGFRILPDIAGSIQFGVARAITPSGSVSVGFGSSIAGTEAVRWLDQDWAVQSWTAPVTLQVLGDLPRRAHARHRDRGQQRRQHSRRVWHSTEGTTSAMIWTPATRMRELKAVLLSDFGIDFSAATLREARGISADGLVIAGLSRRTAGGSLVGWVVDLRGAGSPCPTYPADYNQDGGTTGDDVAAFLTDFEQGFPCADTNLDGV